MLERALKRVGAALGAMLLVVLAGGSALWWLGEGEYTFADALYFALYTAATVGFHELPHLAAHPGARVVTALLIVSGIGAIALFQSSLIALFIEGILSKLFRRHVMRSRIAALSNHVVVAGVGRTGEHVVDELRLAGERFVVIDQNGDLLERLDDQHGYTLLYVVGDATDDHVLRDAGIERARGFISALTSDRDNLFATLSARQLNPRLRIASKVLDDASEVKLRKAGADATVSPNRIGGLRLVSELVRPKVTEFLDQMLRVTGKNLRFDEVAIPEGSPYVRLSLREVPIREKTNLLVVALHEPDGTYTYNPAPDLPLKSGVSLIVIGDPANVEKLRALVAPRG